MRCEYSPSFGQSPQPRQLNLSVPVDTNPNPRRQVSMMYGMQFSSKVPLFQRSCSAIKECGLTQLTAEELHAKVFSFVREVIQCTPQMAKLLSSFQEMEYEMGLCVTRSKKTFSQASSSQRSQDSFSGSENQVCVFRDASNKLLISLPEKTNKTRASMMRKSNRISIADAIKITELQDLKKIVPLQAINSSSSVESQDRTPRQNDRCFQIHSQSSSSDSSEPKLQEKLNICQQRSKKISIMIGQLDCSQFDSEIFSDDGQPLSLKNLRLPEIPFNLSILQGIFDSPCPFLVNLSLCLLCKCMARSKMTLSETSVGWLLSIATIVAYKIYYDEPIGGLVDYFASLLGMESGEVAQLQRWFLQCVGYEVVVSNSQYQSVLFQLVAR